MLHQGSLTQVLAGINAAETEALPPVRLLPAQPQVDRVGLWVTVSGDAGQNITGTLRPVLVLRSEAGAEEQYDYPGSDVTLDVTINGNGDPVREYHEIDLPPGWKWGVRVAALAGAGAEVTRVLGMHGASRGW